MEDIKKEANSATHLTDRKRPGPKPKNNKAQKNDVSVTDDELKEVEKVQENKDNKKSTDFDVSQLKAESEVNETIQSEESIDEGKVNEPVKKKIKTECDKEKLNESSRYTVGSFIEVVRAKSYRFADTLPEYFMGSFTGSVKVLGEVNGMIQGEICKGANNRTIRFFVITN